MEHRFTFLWRLLFLQFALVGTTSLYAQQQFPIRQLLGSYVEAKLQNHETAPSLTRLNTVYKQMDATQQQILLDSIYSGYQQQVSAGKSTECQAYIDLYKFFAAPDDKNLPEMYYVQGMLAAEVYRDSFALKESITDLLICNPNRFEKVPEYLSSLQDLLEKARNYRSLLQDVDGIWVSNNYFVARSSGQPYFVLKIENNGSNIELLETSIPIDEGEWLKKETKNAAKIVDYGESAYLCWSSEKLQVTDEMWVQVAHDFGGNVSSLVANTVTGNSTSFGDVFRGNLAGGLVGMGFDMLFGTLFTPKKYMCILECRLNRVNEVSMSAHAKIQYITAIANEQPRTNISEGNFIFYKYNPKWKILFAEPRFEKLYYADLSKIPNKEMKVVKKKYRSFIRRMKGKDQAFLADNVDKRSKRVKPFNTLQLNKIAYLATQELCEKQGTTQSDKRATIGCILDDLSKYPEAEKKAKRGVYVKNISELSYAFALKKGDVIQSVEGFEVNSPQELNDLIGSMNPFDIAHLQIMRGKKKIEMDMELYYYTNQ